MTAVGQLREVLVILDVGHGNSAVLFSGDDVAVFDAGMGPGLLRFLREQDVDRIKSVVVSHADLDHIGGLIGLLAADTIAIERVVLNTDSLKGSAGWDDLLCELDARHRAGRTRFDAAIRAGDDEVFGTVTATVAAPSTYFAASGPGSTDRSGRQISSNSISAVIRLAGANGPIAVLTGDLDVVGFDELVRAGGKIDAPVLVFPHHGGGTGARDVRRYVTRLIRRVRPRVVVFSIGRGRAGTPDPEIVRYIREAAPDMRIVCTQLSQHCAKSLPAFQPSHLSSAFALGRIDGACCGGTVLISLRDPGRITPESAAHLAFIGRAADTPLCKYSA